MIRSSKRLYLTKDLMCSFDLVRNYKKNNNKHQEINTQYFDSLIKDSIKQLKNNEPCYLFDDEQVETLKKMVNELGFEYRIIIVCKGIWLMERIWYEK